MAARIARLISQDDEGLRHSLSGRCSKMKVERQLSRVRKSAIAAVNLLKFSESFRVKNGRLFAPTLTPAISICK